MVLGLALLGVQSATATVAGENGLIAFERSGDIWVINPDGTGARRVTTDPSSDSQPAWSADGSQIAFVRNGGIWVIRPDGNGKRLVVDSAATESGPAWSPDGSRLVFVRKRETTEPSNLSDLWLVDADGSDERRLTFFSDRFPLADRNGWAFDPDWSPAGDRIVFTLCLDQCGDIATPTLTYVSPATGAIADVPIEGADPSTAVDADFRPSWAPDAGRIAFGRMRYSDAVCIPSNGDPCGGERVSTRVALVDPDGTDELALTPRQENDGSVVPASSPTFSPDGRLIAFSRDEGVWVMAADGREKRQLTNNGSRPSWQAVHASGPLPPGPGPGPAPGGSTTPLPIVVAPSPATSASDRPALGRAAVVATLLASRRVPADVRGWIRRGEFQDQLGLGVHGPGYIRFAELTGDGRRDAIVQVSAGGVGRPHAYYLVTDHGAAARVAFGVRRAFNATLAVRGRGIVETIPLYAGRDALCCAGRTSIRTIQWKDGAFRQVGRRRVVRTRFAVRRVVVTTPAPARSVAPVGVVSPPTPSAPVPGDIYNCASFPLSDGTTAQDYLNRYPSDPSRLDGDNDGQACEG